MKTNNTPTTQPLLDLIKRRFYDPYPYPKRYYKDKRMLLYALTWPAKWLDQRALPIASEDYHKIITQRLDDIAKHGNPQRFQKHFPTYLLKSIQDWFRHHGDELYENLKHVRNSLLGIKTLLDNCQNDMPEDIVTPMARAHAILARRYHRKTRKDTQQLKLF